MALPRLQIDQKAASRVDRGPDKRTPSETCWALDSPSITYLTVRRLREAVVKIPLATV
jgi:hypothetical protein